MITSSPFLHSPIIPSNPNKYFYSKPTPNHFTITSSATTSEPKTASFYEVLGIPMGASNGEVKAAYRKLARVYHPDVAAKDTSAEEFMTINKAYSTLLDPEKRADYDRRLFRVHRGFSTLRASHSPAPAYTRRNWETDQCW